MTVARSSDLTSLSARLKTSGPASSSCAPVCSSSKSESAPPTPSAASVSKKTTRSKVSTGSTPGRAWRKTFFPETKRTRAPESSRM